MKKGCLASVVFSPVEHFGFGTQARLCGSGVRLGVLQSRCSSWDTSTRPLCPISGGDASWLFEPHPDAAKVVKWFLLYLRTTPCSAWAWASTIFLVGKEEIELKCTVFCIRMQLGASGEEPLQRPKSRSSSFWLTRLTHIWHVCVTKHQAFLDSALEQGWAQKGQEYLSLRCSFLCTCIV